MENVKLTLSVPKNLVEPAKKYVARKHTSISKLFTKLISQELENNDEKQEAIDYEFLEKVRRLPISPEVQALTGILKGKVPDDVNLKDLKYEYLKEKYGL